MSVGVDTLHLQPTTKGKKMEDIVRYKGYITATFEIEFEFDFNGVEISEDETPYRVAREAYLEKCRNLTLAELIKEELVDFKVHDYFDITD
jgi:hypothetical protein